ncbi:CU168 protein, partial [Acromyrmex heyeri]
MSTLADGLSGCADSFSVMFSIPLAIAFVNICLADVSYVSEYSTTTSLPPKPYSFQYEAGRYPGYIDRVHQETGDEHGIIHGRYSYIDPKHKIRTVEYTADKSGFHPALINFEDAFIQPADSKAVRLAKEQHFRLYHRIAEANAHNISVNLPRDSASVAKAKDRHNELYHRIAEQHAAIAAQREAERRAYDATSVANDVNDHSTY